MTLIKWYPNLSLNIELVDEQHKLLVKMINDLYDAMHAGKERTIVASLLNNLGIYSSMHFAREEDYLEHFGYPDIDQHKKEHNNFEHNVYKFESDFLDGKRDISKEIMAFLAKWLTNHIIKSDKRFASFLQIKGII
jgi:hemerythrin-like metal-binding protein